jgi:hypothetical protein
MDEDEEGLRSVINMTHHTINNVPAFRALFAGAILDVVCSAKLAVASGLVDDMVRFLPPVTTSDKPDGMMFQMYLGCWCSRLCWPFGVPCHVGFVYLFC